jgi:hypothetical protein
MSFSLRLLLNRTSRTNNIMNKICLTILILFSSLLAEAQGAHLNFTGDAKEFDNNFFSIDLVNGANKTGGAWYPQSFNLDSSFFIDVAVGFGGLGAEGLAIVLHSDSIPVGSGAEQLGVPNTGNSFIVEFDLQQNALVTDATAPHASFFKNGSLLHQGPDVLLDATLNSVLRDNETFRITWYPEIQKFEIQRNNCTASDLFYIEDIKNTIFEGNSKVFFGFTAATSAIADKVHLVLYNNSAGISDDKTICQGEEVKLHAYNTVPTYWSLNEVPIDNEALVSGYEYEVFVQPNKSGYYKIGTEGPCGTSEDSVWVEVLDTLTLSTELITVEGENTVDILLTIEEVGAPYTTDWLLPDLSTSSDKNLMEVPFGLYQVTVTDNNQCSSKLEIELIEESIVDPNPEPEEPHLEDDNDSEIAEQDYFSPNGDGEDEFIRIEVKGQSQILDFKGTVLKIVNYGDLWDGTSDDGKLLPSGLYIVIGEEGKQMITVLR